MTLFATGGGVGRGVLGGVGRGVLGGAGLGVLTGVGAGVGGRVGCTGSALGDAVASSMGGSVGSTAGELTGTAVAVGSRLCNGAAAVIALLSWRPSTAPASTAAVQTIDFPNRRFQAERRDVIPNSLPSCPSPTAMSGGLEAFTAVLAKPSLCNRRRLEKGYGRC